ncbi:hypothetical protein DW262_06605 [Segatella copri]|uniref:Uncharacterized protein n=1 Tax=Segatella copri TaxID=165179 RepID=A0A414UNF6_9BACT|nr:hypothetical protein DW262_06605 [Segatella copri]RHG68227.1 hypothetical protein DW250_03010 [Segatella copri]
MMAKVMYFFGNTKLFCHFLLADIEKVLYIYMPFYDGMGIYIIRWKLQHKRRCFMVLTMCSWQTCGTQNT